MKVFTSTWMCARRAKKTLSALAAHCGLTARLELFYIDVRLQSPFFFVCLFVLFCFVFYLWLQFRRETTERANYTHTRETRVSSESRACALFLPHLSLLSGNRLLAVCFKNRKICLTFTAVDFAGYIDNTWLLADMEFLFVRYRYFVNYVNTLIARSRLYSGCHSSMALNRASDASVASLCNKHIFCPGFGVELIPERSIGYNLKVWVRCTPKSMDH